MSDGFSKLIALLSSTSASQNQKRFVKRFEVVGTYMKLLKGVRVFVANSNNFGHQASSVTILRRLVQLGLTERNQLELVVYADDGDFGPLDTKLKVLIADFKSSAQPFTIGGVAVAATRLVGAKKLTTQAEFGITGGYDDTYHGGDTRFSQINVLNYVQLQPYGWTKGRNLVQQLRKGQTREFVFDKVAKDARIGERAFYRATPKITDWTPYFMNPATEEAAAVAREIVKQVDASAIDLLPAYGIATIGTPANQLYNTAAGMLAAMYGRPGSVPKRPAVLANIQSLGASDWARLQNLIDGKGGPAKGSSFDTWRVDNNVPKRFKLIGSPASPVDEAGIKAAIKASLKSYDVLIAYVGPLPQVVFDLLYAKATMPPVLEGQSSLELMLNLGKPYLKLSREDAATSFGYPRRGAEAITAANIAYDGILTSSPTAWNAQSVQRDRSILQYPPVVLPPMFNAAWGAPQTRSETNLRDYFTGLGTYYHDETNDKLLRALDILVNSIRPVESEQMMALAAAADDGDLLGDLYKSLHDQWEQNHGEINLLTAVRPGLVTDVLSEIVGKTFTISAEEPQQADDKVTVKGTTAIFDQIFGAGETGVAFVFTQSKDADGSAALACAFDAGFDNVIWDLAGAAWLTMGEPRLGFSIDQNGDVPVQGRIGLTVSAGEDIDIGIVLPSEPDTFNFEADFAKPYSIATLFQWIGGINIGAMLPGQLQAVNIGAKSIAMNYNYKKSAVSFISLNAGAPDDFSWTLVPAVEVTALDILTTITAPGDLKTRETTVDIKGSFLIEKSEASIEAHLPKLRVNGGLVDGTVPLHLADLVGTYLGRDFQDALPGFIASVEVTKLSFAVDQSIGSYSFDLDVSTDWPIEIAGTTVFTITALSFSIEATSTDIDPPKGDKTDGGGDAGGNSGGEILVVSAPAKAAAKTTEIAGTFTGTTVILPASAKVGLVVSAAYKGKDAGWTFEGRTTTPIKLGELLKEQLDLDPGGQDAYVIDSLSLKITTKDNSWVFNGAASNWKIDFLDLTIDKATLEAGYNGKVKEQIEAAAARPRSRRTLPAVRGPAHLPPRVAATPEILIAAAAAGKPGDGGDSAGYYGALAVEMTWLGMRINPWVKFASKKKPTWGAVLPDFHLSAEAVYDETTKQWTGKFKFTDNTTLGTLIEAMVSWITGVKFGLEAPWSVLNDISLSNLELDYNFTTGNVTFKVNIGPIDLGICRIDSIDVNYASGQANPKDNGVNVSLNGSFAWNVGKDANGDTSKLGPWDASEPGAAPAPPGGGNKYFDLRLLALGQRVTVNGLLEKKNVAEVIEALENLEIPNPPDIPIGDGVNQPTFAPDSSWFIAFDFGVLKVEKGKDGEGGGAESAAANALVPARSRALAEKPAEKAPSYFISLAIVFNDPQLYALRIGLDGPMAKIFAGLDFQIMYQQVSKNVGKYSAQIVLPDIMRKFQIGVASVTLPTFAIEVYTNGDFQVDLGFPWNEDFSVSFSIEIQAGPLPLMGSAGFYFGKLSSATTDKVPATTLGWFNPVIVFGFGAQIGLGKSVEMGILKAGFSLTVFGIIEGVLARWQPYTTNTAEGAPSELQDGFFFSLTGTFGVQGRLYGSINFAIISADLNIRIAIWVKATFASYEKIPILVQALVDVSLAVKINLGLFKITIYLAFKMTVKATFVLDNPMKGPAPWTEPKLSANAAVMAMSAPARLNARGLQKIAPAPELLLAMDAAPDAFVPDWSRLQKGETLHLTGYVAPVLTVVGDAAPSPDKQPAAYAVSFFLKAQNPTLVETGGAMAASAEAEPVAAQIVPPDQVARAAHDRARALSASSAADALFEDLAIRTLQWVIAAGGAGPIDPQALNGRPVSDAYLASILDYLSDSSRPVPIPVDAIEAFLSAQTAVDFSLQQDKNAEPATAVFFPAAPRLHLSVPAFNGSSEYDYDFDRVNSSTSGYLQQLRIYFDALKVQIEAEAEAAAMAADAPAPGGPSIASFVFADYFAMIARLTVQALREGLSNFKLPIEDVAGLTAAGIVDKINQQMQLDPRDADQSQPYTLGELLSANKTLPLNPAASAPVTISGMTWQAAGGQSFDELAALPAFGGAFGAAALAETNGDDARIIAPGIEVIGNGASYVTQGADSLARIAGELGYATVADLLAGVPSLLSHKTLLAAQSILDIPDFGHGIVRSDTLQSVAQRYALEIAALEVPANGAIVDLFAPDEKEPSLNVPHLAQYNLGDLIDEMVRTLGLQNAAGMVSRYYLHGLRLKTEFASGDKLTPGDKVPLKKDASSYPDDLGLFALTGQTVPLPDIPDPSKQDKGPYFGFTLTAPASGWLKLDGGTSLTYTLDAAYQNTRYLQYAAVRDAAAVYLDMGSSPIAPLSVAEARPARFPLSSEIVWQSAVSIELPTQTVTPETPRPRLWALPNSLINLPHSSGMRPTFAPVIARTDEARGTTTDQAVNNYGFGSLISFKVKRLIGDVTGAAARSYEIAGAPESEITLLERVLDQLTSQTGDFDQINLCYRPSATGSEAKGWQSDDPSVSLLGITQTNLSTETRPEETLAAAAAPAAAKLGNLIGTPNRFLRLLWEASITRSGGFYLSYTTGIGGDPKGLPDHAFNDLGEAELAVLVVYRMAGEKGLTLANFMNVAVTNEAFDLSDAALIAEAVPLTPKDTRAFVPGSDTLRSYADSYYMGLGVLIELNRAQALADQVEVVIEGGMYQVPAIPPQTPSKEAPGGDLNLIAQHFETSVAEIQRVNPGGGNLPATLAPLAAIKLPRITVTVGQTPAGRSFDDLSAYFAVPLAELAAANAGASLFPAVALKVTVGPVSLAPDVQQGVAGVTLTRPEPQVSGTGTPDKSWGEAYLRQTFSLLGYRIADNPGNTFFQQSDWGLPCGPIDPEPSNSGDKVQAANAGAPDGIWHFTLSVPYAQIAGGGDPSASPYLGVGELLQFDMAWLDIFGNRILSEIRDPDPAPGKPLNKAPQITGYTDRLLGIGQWPGVAAAYQVASDGGTPAKPELTLKLRFDDGTYMKAGQAARGADPDAAAAGKRTLAQAVRTYTVIVQQQDDPAGVTATLSTTLTPDSDWEIPKTHLKLSDIRPTATGGSYGLNQWAELILAYLQTLSDPDQPVTPFAWVDYGRTESLSGTINDAQIFKLETKLTFARDPMRVAGGLRTTAGVPRTTTQIPAWTGPLGTEQTRSQRTLDDFARDFTGAFAATAGKSYRIATGSDSNVFTGGAKPLWVAEFGDEGTKTAISYEIRDASAPTIYAPRPISNVLKSKAKTRIIPYTTGAPLSADTPPQVSAFASVDLDRWMSSTLTAIDALLTPKYVTPADILSRNIEQVPLPAGRTQWPNALQSLLDAKEALAGALQGAMTAVYTDEDPNQVQKTTIREAFRQVMLGQVSQFYAVKAGLQFEADVYAAIEPQPSAVVVPRIYGNIGFDKPVDTLPNLTVSSPKLDLKFAGTPKLDDAPSPYLNSLLSSTTSDVASVSLDLSYQGKYIEHEIGKLPGIEGYRPSTWLSFVDIGTKAKPDPLPLTRSLGSFDVPIILRAYPEMPTLVTQESVADFTPQCPPDTALAASCTDVAGYAAAPASCPKPGSYDPFGAVTLWAYAFEYAMQLHAQQDAVHGTVTFNIKEDGGAQSNAEDPRDLFEDLAEFAGVYPKVLDDLNTYLLPIDVGTMDVEQLTNAQYGMESAATLVDWVARTAASEFAREPEPDLRAMAAAEVAPVGFAISEGQVDVEQPDGSGKVRALEIALSLDAPLPQRVGAPEIAIDGYTCARQPGGDTQKAKFLYLYKDSETGKDKYLEASIGRTIPGRRFVLPDLEIVERQDAQTEVYLTRNADIVKDHTIDDRFVYQTPKISFESPLHPTLFHSDPINIALGAAVDRDHPVKRTFACQLSVLYESLFRHAGTSDVTMQLVLYYAYSLNDDLEKVRLPVFLMPPTKARLVPEGATAGETLDQIVAMQAATWQMWYDDHAPSLAGGQIQLELTVMSDLTARPMPILRMTGLYLPVNDIEGL